MPSFDHWIGETKQTQQFEAASDIGKPAIWYRFEAATILNCKLSEDEDQSVKVEGQQKVQIQVQIHSKVKLPL